MLFADTPAADLPTWISTIVTSLTALAIVFGLVSQIILQVLAAFKASQATTLAQTAVQLATKHADSIQSSLTTVLSNQHDKMEKIDALAGEVVATHMLVNSQRSELLKLSAVQARRLATLNPDNADDQKAALLAEQLYKDHQDKQAAVDATALKRPTP